MPLRHAQIASEAVAIDADGRQDGDILDLTTPAAFEHDAVQIHVGKAALYRLGATPWPPETKVLSIVSIHAPAKGATKSR